MTDPSHDKEMLRRLIRIDHKTDSVQDSLAWLVRSNAHGLKEELLAAFGKSRRRAQVYLALDGNRNVTDLATHLGMHSPNISTELRSLKKLRLVDTVEAENSGTVYNKKFFDSVVGLSDALMDKFSLDESGRDTK